MKTIKLNPIEVRWLENLLTNEIISVEESLELVEKKKDKKHYNHLLTDYEGLKELRNKITDNKYK